MSQIRRRKGGLGETDNDNEEHSDNDKISAKQPTNQDAKASDDETGKIVLDPGSYWLTRIIFLRFLAFIYLVAFYVSFNQNKELVGNSGLLPASLHLMQVKQHVKQGWDRILAAPSLLWILDGLDRWDALDEMLDWIAVTGLVLSSLVMITGAANMLVMSALWMLYFSLVSVGQQWFSFGWESQLLETGFLAIWCVPVLKWDHLPRHLPSPWVGVWGYRWLIFRIMLGAGLIKIRGDQCWRDLTCMDYFYQTQPNPNPLSYLMHQAPSWWHTFETFGNHCVELVFPFCTWLPFRGAWMFNGFWQILFQLILISTGNLSFLNWLTIAPSIWYFDDRFLSSFFSQQTNVRVKVLQNEDKALAKEGKSRTWLPRKILTLTVAAGIAYLSLPIVVNLVSKNQAMNRSYDPLRIVNTYGAFGSVTKTRTEVVIQGTYSPDPESPGAVWREYEFNCKPGDPAVAPCFISPYHYRLDWLMWFAAFQDYRQNPWLIHLMGKFLENDPVADSLIRHNPFQGQKPPLFVRAKHFKYTFTKMWSKSSQEGKWWNRKVVGDYVPAVNLDALKGIYQQFGWKMKKELVDMMDEFVKLAKEDALVEAGWPKSAYNVSKVGVSALTRIQQRSVDSNILINHVHPGFVDTDMTTHKGHLTVTQGAAPIVWAATLPEDSSVKGQYIWKDGSVIDWVDTPLPEPF